MNRNRFFVFGCLGAIGLISALVAILYFSVRGPFELARSRWADKGGGDYTLVVSQYCFCGLAGEFKITVQAGHVTAFEPVGSALGPAGSGSMGIAPSAKPADFDRMTVTAMLSRAERDQPDAWTAPWTHKISIAYDPAYGYVTSYNSDENGRLAYLFGLYRTDSGYTYNAHDLVLSEP